MRVAVKPKVKERQTEFWTSRAIESFFLDEGYEVTTFPLSGVTEGELPLDYIFWTPQFSKMFGIQYKALYGWGDEDYWPIDVAQLAARMAIPWAVYSLSEIEDPRQWRSALHRQVLVFPNRIEARTGHHQIKRRELGEKLKYARWGALVAMIERCDFGLRVESAEGLRSELQRLVRSPNAELLQMVDLFVADKEERKLLHLDPMLRAAPRSPDEELSVPPVEPWFGRNLDPRKGK